MKQSYTLPGRRGHVLIYTMVALPLFCAVCLLAVDVGRVQSVRTELERATHAAARHAVGGVQDGTYLDRANWLGQHNAADGQPVVFTLADVEVGRWDPATKTLVVGAASPNAVRVTGRRTVPAIFGGWSGVAAKEVVARATVRFSVVGFGLIGLDSVNMQGNATASYSSAGGGLSGQGNVGSNGSITLGGSTTVNGNTYVGTGQTVSNGHVTGSKNTLAAPLSYPNGSSAPYSMTNNNNGLIPTWAYTSGTSNFSIGNGQAVTLPGGHYYFNNFAMTGTSSLTFTGPATIYCTGTFEMSGKTYTSADKPPNLKLVMVPNPDNGNPPMWVKIGSSAAFYGSIYAPQSDVTVGGTADVYGSVLGKTVNMTGTGRVVYDMALEAQGGTLSLVE